MKQFKTRLSEHYNHIHRHTNQHSVITEHRLKFNHEFDWNNIKILDEEKTYKRLISESNLH